jgi:nitrogen regulatory protein P-II
MVIAAITPGYLIAADAPAAPSSKTSARPSARWVFRALPSPRCGASGGNGGTPKSTGALSTVEFVPKTRVEIAVTDSLVEQVIEAISTAARDGKVGDGKIFVLDGPRGDFR